MVALLHGLGSSCRDWQFQEVALEDRYRVVAVDLPGHGSSAQPRRTVTIESMADDVAALLAEIDGEPAHVVGLSLGACVALRLALQAPARVRSLTLEQPPLPDFSSFHFAFRGRSVEGRAETRDGDIRSAFFLSYDDENCEYVGMDEAARAIKAGRDLVSALFVIPYPPGFPILVPGQVISAEILQFMAALDVREIHGFRPELGFRIFNDAALARVAEATAARAALAVSGRAAFPIERDSQTSSKPVDTTPAQQGPVRGVDDGVGRGVGGDVTTPQDDPRQPGLEPRRHQRPA